MDDSEDWYYCFTLFSSLGSILAACSLIFIPWHIKNPGPRVTMIKYQAIADIIFASSNVLVFLHPSLCAIPLGITKVAKSLSILFAVILSLMHTNLFDLEPQALTGARCKVICVLIALLCGFFSVWPFHSEGKSCISILNTPHSISKLLIGDGLVPMAVIIAFFVLCCNCCKSRSKRSFKLSPLLLILIWIIDLIAIVIQYCLDEEIPKLMDLKLLVTRSIGIVNWWIYRKKVLSLHNPKQGLEKALECLERSEPDEAISITNQVERSVCQIHGFALLYKASRLQDGVAIEKLCKEGEQELKKSLDRKYYRDLEYEQLSHEESKDNDEQITALTENIHVQINNQERTERDRILIEDQREVENQRKVPLRRILNHLRRRSEKRENGSEDIEGIALLIENVEENDSLGLLAHQLNGVALCYNKDYAKALKEFEKSLE